MQKVPKILRFPLETFAIFREVEMKFEPIQNCGKCSRVNAGYRNFTSNKIQISACHNCDKLALYSKLKLLTFENQRTHKLLKDARCTPEVEWQLYASQKGEFENGVRLLNPPCVRERSDTWESENIFGSF